MGDVTEMDGPTFCESKELEPERNVENRTCFGCSSGGLGTDESDCKSDCETLTGVQLDVDAVRRSGTVSEEQQSQTTISRTIGQQRSRISLDQSHVTYLSDRDTTSSTCGSGLDSRMML